MYSSKPEDPRPPISRLVIAGWFVSLALATGCGRDAGRPAAQLVTSPTAVASTAPSGEVGNSAWALRPFPGREQAYQFRTVELEQAYRNMGRGRVSTNVNPEGSVIWVGEYLRYRAGQCSHEDAITRIRTQINGQGVPAACGQTEQPFPGRTEALAFRQQLEGIYQGRGAALADTVVDAEGDVIWTMEYYRYVLSGCSHASTIQKIMDQIAGRGVGADCAPPPRPVTPPTPPVTPPVTPPPTATLTGSFSAQNTPCLAPASGPVSCRFVASASGAVAPYTYSWRFTTPLSNTTTPGQQVSPDLGCGFSTGVVTFNVTIALTITPASGASITLTGSQQIARDRGVCGA